MSRRITINEGFKHQSSHTSIEQTGDPIVHTFDERELGEGPARALSKAIAEGIRAISATATKATLARRGRAHGGTLATHAPGSPRLFNSTGRLAGLAVRYASGAWEVVAPADRLQKWTAANAARAFERLRALVPALGKPLEHRAVVEAIEESVRGIFGKR